MKRRLAIILLISIFILQYTPASVNANGDTDEVILTFDQLQELYETQSTLVKEIELQNEIDRQTYSDILDEYADLEEAVQQLQDQMEILQIQIDQSIQAATNAEKNDTVTVAVPPEMLPPGAPPQQQEVDAKEYYLNMQLPGLMNAKGMIGSMYEEIVQKQLSTYAQMEMLKLQLDYSDKDKEQKLMSSNDDFTELCYDYHLLTLEHKLIQLEQQLLQVNIKNLEKQLTLGLSTPTDLYAKESDLLILKQSETMINNQLEQRYHTILKILDLHAENEPEFDITIMQPQVTKIMGYDTFKSIAKSDNLSIKMLEEQGDIYDKQEELAYVAYDQKDVELEKILLEIERNRITNNQALQQMEMLNLQKYQSFSTALKQIEVSKATYEIASKEYEYAKSKQELGQLSDVELLEAAYQYEKAQYEYEKAKVEYIKSYHSFEEAL